MSLFLKHIYCYQLLIKECDTYATLIFEDDVILSDKFNDKINLPIDLWLNKVIKDNKLKVYWSEPTIVSQGSQTGLFELSI